MTTPATAPVPPRRHELTRQLSPRVASLLPALAAPSSPRLGEHDANAARSPRPVLPGRGDGGGHGPAPASRQRLDFQLPASKLPPSAHVKQQRPVRPDKDEFTAVWDDATETWQVTVFPALLPSGREQVRYLRECLNRMLQAENRGQHR